MPTIPMVMFQIGASASGVTLLIALITFYAIDTKELSPKERLQLVRQKFMLSVAAGSWLMIFAIGIKVFWG